MRLPPEARVQDVKGLVAGLASQSSGTADVLLALWTRERKEVGALSTGEAKRLLLSAVLARPAPFLLLDEPYEHLSDGGREVLTKLLMDRCRGSVVVVATNQPVPECVRSGRVLRLDVGGVPSEERLPL
jgi:ABC-type transport system involved in cytochrome c biogenesis ATPase subunit